MHWFVGAMGFVGLLFGFYAFFGGKTALHEIEGMIGFAIGAIGLGAAGIIEALERVRKQLKHNAAMEIAMHKAEHPELHAGGAVNSITVATAETTAKCPRCKKTGLHRINEKDQLVCLACEVALQSAKSATPPPVPTRGS